MSSNFQLHLSPADWRAAHGNVPSLDGLRAVSIAIVLMGHMVLPASLLGISALGVKIFFFISGFLITRLLLAENRASGHVSLGNFYIRRFLRLYPVLIVYMILVVAVTLARGNTFAYVDAASVFFYFVNYLLIQYELVNQGMTLPVSVLWSLSVEEHFYLFAPLAFVFVRGNALKMLVVAVAICVLSLGIRLAYAAIWPDIIDTLLIYKHSETRFDSIAFGVVLACMTELGAGRRLIALLSTRTAFVCGLIVLLGSFALRDAYFQNTWRFTIQGLSLFPIVAGLVFAQPFGVFNAILNSRPFVWVGRLSYSLYVWHGGVLFLFGWAIGTLHGATLGFVELALTLMLATLSFYIVERPVLALRKRFRERAPAAPVDAIVANA
jgi:peptidoglycan/LPS O-acetylase OafA/YrhL